MLLAIAISLVAILGLCVYDSFFASAARHDEE